jgi:hypothetical protein
MAKHDHITGGKGLPAFNLIDLDDHPDAALLKACAQATKLRDNLETIGKHPFGSLDCPSGCNLLKLCHFIAHTDALTDLGVTMKATFVMGDQADPMEQTPRMLYVSVIKDFLRMGVPA